MVLPAFDIGNSNIPALPEGCRLLVEISAQSLNYLVYTRNPDQLFMLREYRIYTEGDRTTRDVLDEIISEDPLLIHFSRKAMIVYNFPASGMLPSARYDPSLDAAVAGLINGDTSNDFVFREEVKGLGMHNVYCISKDVHSLCRDRFGGSTYWHFYTMLLQWPRQPQNGRHLSRVIFYNDKFIVAFFTADALQLVQTFTYQTPEDAAYYLLLICKQFGVAQREMHLVISGLIDTQSAMYAELLKYFPEVHYEGLPESYGTNGLLDEFPGHYFSPLLKLSLCV